MSKEYVVALDQLRMSDIEKVGGKNASLGEMIAQLTGLGVNVPNGFATTSLAYRDFLSFNGLTEKIEKELSDLDVENINTLKEVGSKIRAWIIDASFQPELEDQITKMYQQVATNADVSFAIRSSATAEDLPDASFAGQQETFLNVYGLEMTLLKIKEVYASLYNDRAISYRVHKNFAHSDVALSACVQRMVRSDLGSSGVMFTIDTESGFKDVVFITSNYGLGETVVQGSVNPDEFYISKQLLLHNKPAVISRSLGTKKIKMKFSDGDSTSQELVEVIDVEPDDQKRFSINDGHLQELAAQAVTIERHYGRPMDIEWAYDGIENSIYIVQARPETVQNQVNRSQALERYRLLEKSNVLVTGAAIGNRIGSGECKILSSIDEMDKVNDGDVLVTTMTDPDWEPIMKRAAAIVTERGGRTCHAAIIARELGVPAVVGSENATALLESNSLLTVSCAEGEVGKVYQGALPYEVIRTELDDVPELPLKVMINVGNPAKAMSFANIPNDGVGLARLEFIINNKIGIHPRALMSISELNNELKEKIIERTQAYKSPTDFYIQKIIEGVSTLATVFYPKPVIVRCSDFKSNEYANLLGGGLFEPTEENPMLGYRGTSRYLSKDFEECFALECEALKYVRDDMGLTNVWLMVPFVRTLEEASLLNKLLQKNGLERGINDLKIMMMCEIPSNAILAEQFLEYFDGFSIGSNDMTQLTLGVDRDSALVSHLFDERDEAVKFLLKRAIEACNKAGKYVGICGQGPSDHPDLAKWLLESGIESISLNPDSVIETMYRLNK